MVCSEAHPIDDGRARSIALALEIHICFFKKIDPPIRTEYCLSGGATTLIFDVGGGNSVGFFVIALTNLLEHGGATWQHERNVQILPGVNVTLHDVVERCVVDSAGLNANEIGWKKTLVQRKRSPLTVKMFPSESLSSVS